jgi:hypothetical protein
MALQENDLKKFIKKTDLVISAVEDDSSENTQILKLTLAEKVPSIKGSNPTDQGQDMVLREVETVYIAGDDDIEAFKKDADLDEASGIISYKGPMKLDVSKPNGRFVNNVFVITKPAKAWLTSVGFNKRGAGLRSDRQSGLSAAVAKFFTDQGAAAPQPQNVIGSAKDLTPVDTTANGSGTKRVEKQNA